MKFQTESPAFAFAFTTTVPTADIESGERTFSLSAKTAIKHLKSRGNRQFADAVFENNGDAVSREASRREIGWNV